MEHDRRAFLADVAVHALGLVLGAAGAVAMLAVAARGERLAVAVYLVGLAAMLGCSALYNVWRSCPWRDWLRRLDHAAIFVMIAGTYTPLALRLPGAWAIGLTTGVWTAAAVGVAVKLLQPHRVETLSVALYLALGWIGLVAIEPLLASLDRTTLVLLLAGGVVYSGGVVFHLSASRSYGRALWHGSVLIAAALHYAAILSMLEA
jgi:hemolysin III